ncbi:MAG TPA: DUF6498-containing protein [Candidatus Heimdallarchaeota archaeon]|nr:DUF6498-containing protein [Candidatus Heimdallarchaeota archaeon]
MFRVSIGALFLFNLIPLAGVLFFGWNLSSIMVLYWFENVIIGFFNALKMAKAEGTTPRTKLYSGNKAVTIAQKSSSILFFIVHFGMFTFGHGVFIFAFFGRDLPAFSSLLIAALCLFVSHGISYAYNFIRNEEYKRVAFQDLFFQPYKRIIIMHVTIVVGAFIAFQLEQPTFFLILLIFLKIVVDLFSHKKEHTKFAN